MHRALSNAQVKWRVILEAKPKTETVTSGGGPLDVSNVVDFTGPRKGKWREKTKRGPHPFFVRNPLLQWRSSSLHPALSAESIYIRLCLPTPSPWKGGTPMHGDESTLSPKESAASKGRVIEGKAADIIKSQQAWPVNEAITLRGSAY